MNQETADQGWLSPPGNHMMGGALENTSAVANKQQINCVKYL